MHPAAPLPRYDCKCVLWQPSKHNSLARLLIFCTRALPAVSWQRRKRRDWIDWIMCIVFLFLLVTRFCWPTSFKGTRRKREREREIENVASMLSPAHLRTPSLYTPAIQSRFLGPSFHWHFHFLFMLFRPFKLPLSVWLSATYAATSLTHRG